ncbi:synaptobrevin-domain-containing protein [Catenaria anguillulae PL171]|uniref:Synaptobrevin-domain-containing protein n=1 Tax=Catenaria anguillulae PL171 TaxID=765915 RepID=A0A1Y2HJV2_9FUNG|nr:synaptobrevin-domain-containing protein [Catenaria anguillulae PL171]
MPPSTIRRGVPGALTSAIVLRNGVVLAHHIPQSHGSVPAPGSAPKPARASNESLHADERAPLLDSASPAASDTRQPYGSGPSNAIGVAGLTPVQLPTLLREMAGKLGEAPLGKISVSPRQVVHYLFDGDRNQLVVAMLCSSDYSPRLALETLKLCHSKLVALPGIAAAPVGEVHRQVLSILTESITHIEATLGADAWTTAKGDLEEVKEVMLQNIEQVLARGERLEDLVQRTEGITNQSVRFFVRSRDAARRAAWKQYKFIAISVFIVVILLLSAGWVTCGFPGFQHCVPHF